MSHPGAPLRPEELEPWLEERFDTSSGPGGQRLNRVATRVTLLFDLERCPALDDRERERLRARLRTRLARDGRLRIVAAVHREQAANRLEARERLVGLLTAALATERTRRPTRPTAGSRRRRLAEKKRQSERKRDRRRPPAGD